VVEEAVAVIQTMLKELPPVVEEADSVRKKYS
jgi:hypothetical protein